MSKRNADDSPDHGQNAKRQRKMFDGKFYTLNDNDDENTAVAQCMLCTIKPTFIRGSHSSTGNFYKHFKRVHTERVDELKDHGDSKTKPASQAIKKNEKVQSLLPFVNTLDTSKVSVFYQIFTIFSSAEHFCNF